MPSATRPGTRGTRSATRWRASPTPAIGSSGCSPATASGTARPRERDGRAVARARRPYVITRRSGGSSGSRRRMPPATRGTSRGRARPGRRASSSGWRRAALARRRPANVRRRLRRGSASAPGRRRASRAGRLRRARCAIVRVAVGRTSRMIRVSSSTRSGGIASENTPSIEAGSKAPGARSAMLRAIRRRCATSSGGSDPAQPA